MNDPDFLCPKPTGKVPDVPEKCSKADLPDFQVDTFPEDFIRHFSSGGQAQDGVSESILVGGLDKIHQHFFSATDLKRTDDMYNVVPGITGSAG